MPAEIDMDFIIAITFVVAAIILVLSAFAYQLVSSGKRLKKAQRLSDAILEYTPAFIMIIFDDKKKVVSFNTRMPSFQGFDGKPPLGKSLMKSVSCPASFARMVLQYKTAAHQVRI